MTWGALLTNNSGNAFVTPDSTPIALYSKVTVNSFSKDGYQYAEGIMPIPDTTVPVIPVMFATQPSSGQVALVAAARIDGGLAFSATNIVNSSFSVTCFLFTWFPQPMPNPPWGMAIWDAKGKLILTHETKVLTDLLTIGSQGSSNSGVNIDTTLNGMYGIIPRCSGLQVWRVSSGGPGGTLISTAAYFSAMFNGSTTRIMSAPITYPGPNAIPSGGTNNGNVATVLDVTRYL